MSLVVPVFVEEDWWKNARQAEYYEQVLPDKNLQFNNLITPSLRVAMRLLNVNRSTGIHEIL